MKQSARPIWPFRKHLYICSTQNQSNSLTAKNLYSGVREQ
jgi:hypothetical protein